VEAQKLNLPKPTSWADLTKPIYAGKIVMPHPASSGTGLPRCQRLDSMMGEDKAGLTWMPCTRISVNTPTPARSHANKLATGEFPIGIRV